MITAEPYAAVTLPSSVIVAENALNEDTKVTIETARIEYRGHAEGF
jgi:hypothetical protein